MPLKKCFNLLRNWFDSFLPVAVLRTATTDQVFPPSSAEPPIGTTYQPPGAETGKAGTQKRALSFLGG